MSPIDVPADGNCLYHSIASLDAAAILTARELRGMSLK